MGKLKQRADGRYRKGVDGKAFYGKSEREVNRKILEYEEKKSRGRTFEEVAREWRDCSWDALAIQTLRGYKPAYRRAVEEFGARSIKEIEPKDISLFLLRLGKLGYAQKTVANHRIVINQVFSHALTYGDVLINPCVASKIPKGLAKNKRYAASEEDERKVMATDHPFLVPRIALYTGMRRGEILALQWKDVDLKHNVISVNKSIGYDSNSPFVKSPKTEAGNRLVPLLQPLRAILEPLKEKSRPDEYIISDDGKKPLTNKRYEKLYNTYKEEVGIECTAHQLRHSYATIAVEEGLDVKPIQAIMGHSSSTITLDTYAELRRKGFDIAAEKLNKRYANDT